jgi:hypothetical protein
VGIASPSLNAELVSCIFLLASGGLMTNPVVTNTLAKAKQSASAKVNLGLAGVELDKTTIPKP